jgi:hypothetical protein
MNGIRHSPWKAEYTTFPMVLTNGWTDSHDLFGVELA